MIAVECSILRGQGFPTGQERDTHWLTIGTTLLGPTALGKDCIQDNSLYILATFSLV